MAGIVEGRGYVVCYIDSGFVFYGTELRQACFGVFCSV